MSRRDPEARRELALKARWEYESGLTVEQVSVELGVSYGKAYALIKEVGGVIRARGRGPATVADPETAARPGD